MIFLRDIEFVKQKAQMKSKKENTLIRKKINLCKNF